MGKLYVVSSESLRHLRNSSSARDFSVLVLVLVNRVFDYDYDFLVEASPTLLHTPYLMSLR